MLWGIYSAIYDEVNRLNAELKPIRHLLALVGARHIVHVSRIGVNVSVEKCVEIKGEYVEK